jgi:hypothetical protein
MTLHQSGYVTVARPAQQIALPMSGNGTIFDFRRSFADGDSVHDPALGSVRERWRAANDGSAAVIADAEPAPVSALLALE